MEISIDVNEDLIESLGLDAIKGHLTAVVSRLELKMAAQEALAELATIDLTNDPEWQVARMLAWEQEKHHFSPHADV